MIKSLVLTVIAAAVATLVLVALPSQSSHHVGGVGRTSADGVVNTVTPDATPSPDTLLWP